MTEEPGLSQLAQWRADTPGASRRTHLNNAGAGLMPAPVLSAMETHLRREAELGGYEAADASAAVVDRAYREVAGLIGTKPRNIAMVENATVAVSQALSAFDFEPGDAVVTSRADYVSNQLMLLSLARRRRIEIRRAADLPDGGIDPTSVDELLADGRVRLVVLSWIPTNSGLIQNVAAVGAICARRGIPYLVDGCQAVGQLPVDVTQIQCDFFGATARKFLRGPRGQGFLAVSDRILAEGKYPLYLDLRGGDWTAADDFIPAIDARRFENWEFSYAGVLGLGEAARYARTAETAAAYDRVRWLATVLRDRVSAIPGVRVLDRGRSLAAIVTADLGVDAQPVRDALRARAINTSVTTRAAAVIDMDAKGVQSALRLSPHYYNTTDEIDRCAEALSEILRDRPSVPAKGSSGATAPWTRDQPRNR